MQIGPLVTEQPLWPWTMPEPHEVDRLFAQAFALVGEGIAGATHALLAGDRDAAKALVKRDEVIDKLIGQISTTVQYQLVHGETTSDERREYVAILRMLPDMERNGDLAEHIARRAARGLGAEMSARSRGPSSGWARWPPPSGGRRRTPSPSGRRMRPLHRRPRRRARRPARHPDRGAGRGDHAAAGGDRAGHGGALRRALRRPRRQPGPPHVDPRDRRPRAGFFRPRLTALRSGAAPPSGPGAPSGSGTQRQELFGDLHHVERGALAQIVTRDEEGQCVGCTLGPPDAADIGNVAAGCQQRRRDPASSTPGAVRSTSVARSGVMGRSNSQTMAAECPVKTGTRTQVVVTARSGRPRILRASLQYFCSSSVSSEPSSTICMQRDHVVGDRDRVDAARGNRRTSHRR